MFHFCLSIWVIPKSPLAEVIYIIYLSTLPLKWRTFP